MKFFICTAILILYAILILESALVMGFPWPSENSTGEIHDAQVKPSLSENAGAGPTESQDATNCNCPLANVSTETPTPTVVIFLSSVRKGRMAERMGKFVEKAVKESGMNSRIVDPAEIPFEMLRDTLSSFKNAEDAPIWLRETNDTISSANAFMVVSAEYNGEIPPALTNMLDHFPFTTFANRPTGIVTYSTGSMGGVRVSVVLRPFLSNLGMITLPTHVPIPKVSKNIDEEGNCSNEKLIKNLNQLTTELKWFANALDYYKQNFYPLVAAPLYS